MLLRLEEVELKKTLKVELELANEKNKKSKKADNNYINIVKNGNKVDLILLENNKKVGELEISIFRNIFSYRDNFVAKYDEKSGELKIVTNVRLHGHTGYSLLDSTIKVKDLVKKTVYSTAITDHGVLYGVLDFYKEMKENHNKPIIGFEAYTESISGVKDKRHLVLLAKNKIGFENLSKLSSFAHKNYGGKFPQRPLVKYEWLEKYSEGIIALSACIGGEIPQAILKGDLDLAYKIAKNFKRIFGEDFYLEIQRHYIDVEKSINEEILKIGQELGIKVVATDDAHYLNEDDALAHEVHLCNKTGKVLSDEKRYKFPGKDYFVHTVEEMENKFKDVPETLFNTLEIMDKCNFKFDFGNYKLPNYPLPEGTTEAEYFEKLCWEGFEKRFPIGTVQNSSKEYRDRLKFEIDTIKNMGYPSYFIIVWDFVKYAKENDIPVGPGRGSACGSLCAYVLNITDLNPIPYNLLFERFLNPDRVSMPDWNIYNFII